MGERCDRRPVTYQELWRMQLQKLWGSREGNKVRKAFHVHQALSLSTAIAGGCTGLCGDQGQRLTRSPRTHTCTGKETNSLILLPHPFGLEEKPMPKVPGVTTVLGTHGSLTTLWVKQGAVGCLWPNQEECLERGWETTAQKLQDFSAACLSRPPKLNKTQIQVGPGRYECTRARDAVHTANPSPLSVSISG